jgi:7-cyano-7-deazaguanine synthase
MKSTIVPNRNMIFICYAIAYSIANNISEVWYGAHAGDHFIYPDCRPAFLDSMNQAAGLCDPSEVSVMAAFINLNKGEIFRVGLDLNLDYSKTWTCYEGLDNPCGKCGSCVERLEAFADNKSSDPLVYS